MKKVFALLLSVAMVICMMPSMAFAANVDGPIAITIKAPVAGESPEETIAGDATYDGTIAWADSEGNAVGADETQKNFVEGAVYTATVTLNAKTGSTFTDQTSVTINDEATKTELEGDNKLTCEFTFTAALEKEINRISVEAKEAEGITFEYGTTPNWSDLITVKAFPNADNDEGSITLTSAQYAVDFDPSAGTQSVTVTAGGKSDNSLSVEITKKEISISGATLANATKEYDETTAVDVDAVTFEDGEKNPVALTKGEAKDYTVTGAVADAKAGTDKAVTVTVTLKGDAAKNYELASSTYTATDLKVTITPKTISISGAILANGGSKEYDGNTVVGISSVTFEGATLTKDDDYTATGKVADANVGADKPVTVTVTLNGDAATNYELASRTYNAETLKATITKKRVTAADTTVTVKKKTEAQTVTVEKLAGIPSDAGEATYALGDLTSVDETIVNKDADATKINVTSGEMTIALKATNDATDDITIPVTVTSTNYDITMNVVVKLTDLTVPEVTFENDTIEVNYTKTAVTLDGLTATFTADGETKEIAGEWAFDGDATPTNVADSGTYAITFTPTVPDGEDATYAPVTKSITVTIKPVEPTVTATVEEITESKKLSAVTLTATATGVEEEAVAGTIAWKDANAATIDVVAGTPYTWIFTPNSTNYKSVEGSETPLEASTPTPGGGGVIVTDPLPTAKNEATNAVQNYVKPADYEEAEAAEIKAIMDKAAADIKNAKTAEEVKAIEAAAKEAIDKIDTAEEKAVIRTVEATKFRATSKRTTLNGKKAIKITWNKPEGVDFDGYDIYRSTKQFSGFGKTPFFTTTKQTYTNNKGLEVGKTYYYKVRAFKYVNGRKVYSEYSYKAIRTMK